MWREVVLLQSSSMVLLLQFSMVLLQSSGTLTVLSTQGPPSIYLVFLLGRVYACTPFPPIMYIIHSNGRFATHTYIDTSSYQIVGNLKIVTTAIPFRTFLKRKLSKLQWMVILLLTIGTAVSQMIIAGAGETDCRSLPAALIQFLGILSARLSAMAGVYNEFLMKKNQDSLYRQNMQLYAEPLHQFFLLPCQDRLLFFLFFAFICFVWIMD